MSLWNALNDQNALGALTRLSSGFADDRPSASRGTAKAVTTNKNANV